MIKSINHLFITIDDTISDINWDINHYIQKPMFSYMCFAFCLESLCYLSTATLLPFVLQQSLGEQSIWAWVSIFIIPAMLISIMPLILLDLPVCCIDKDTQRSFNDWCIDQFEYYATAFNSESIFLR